VVGELIIRHIHCRVPGLENTVADAGDGFRKFLNDELSLLVTLMRKKYKINSEIGFDRENFGDFQK